MFFAAALVLATSTNDILPIEVGGMLCHPQRLMMKLKLGIMPFQIRLSGSKILGTMPEIRWCVVEVPKGKLLETKEALSQGFGVEQVTFDRAARPAYTPNDPMWPDQWSLPSMNVNTAWDLSLGSNSAIVAVIDTGVETAHPDLAANIWVNAGEIPGNSIDDDNNGYVDDINGYDFAYNDAIPNDVFGHGTPCAGIVAAVGDNNIGLSGVAPRAKIMAIKACIDSGYFYDSMTVPAYLYAANNGARIFSCSFFSDQVSPSERDAINFCWDNNVLPIVAAGNASSVIPFYPGAYDNSMGVAAYGTNGNKAGFSNWGAWVDVSAPGTNVVSTALNGAYTTGFAGTSAACPHAAGVAALLLGARPTATNVELRNAIEDTATAVNQAPFGEYCNYGKVNARLAMEAILGTPAQARTPVVRYVSMLGNQPNDVIYPEDNFLVSRIYGRGFQSPNTVEASISGVPVPILNQTRDYIEFEYLPPQFGPFAVKVNNIQISNLTMPRTYRVCYPMSEASTPSASTFGGFLQTLVSDGNLLRCTRQSDGIIFAQTTFHKVQLSAELKLRIRRHYTSTEAASLERIRVYDWSSASYPYGSFVELSAITPPLSPTLSVFTLPNPSRFLDDERTVYVTITTSGMPSGAELRIDEVNITSDR